MLDKLWIYTNYDCNLACSYCVAESHPRAARRGLELPVVRQLVDEASELGFRRFLLTGGEPFILEDIYEMIAYAAAHADTTVLTNGLLLNGRRLDRLCEVAGEQVTVQVSLDGARPEHHDPYRGEGTWAGTVAAIGRLRQRGLNVRIATTVTPANAHHLDELNVFRHGLGIADEDHVVRPLARRGLATEGDEIGRGDVIPEVTATRMGIFWHPIASPSGADMYVTPELFPLADAVEEIERQLTALAQERAGKAKCVT